MTNIFQSRGDVIRSVVESAEMSVALKEHGDDMENATEDLSLVVYSPESPLQAPVQLLREIVVDTWRSRELVGILFVRDLKAQFRQSYLGYFWLIMPPLMTTAVWLFLNSQRVVSISDPGMPYAVFVLIGTVFWQSFANALQAPLNSFQTGKPVFMKIKVPPEAFVAAGSARAVFDFLISLVLLIPVFVIYRVMPPATIILIPVAMVALYLLATSIGMLLLPIGGLYTDVGRGTNVMLRFAMYMCPVVYPVPESGLAARLIGWNPVTPILECARAWLVSGETPHIWTMIAWMPVSAAVLVVGALLLRVAMPHVVARMGM